MAIDFSGKDLTINNLGGIDFEKKYGFKCPVGVRGRNSDNKLYKEHLGWEPTQPLSEGMALTYAWIKSQVDAKKPELA